MAQIVMMKNDSNGLVKKGVIGFSWTYLLFGWWVPLLRGELGVAALHLLFSIVTFGLWQFIVSFLYNKQYTSRLIENGYRFADSESMNIFAAGKIGVDLASHFNRVAA